MPSFEDIRKNCATIIDALEANHIRTLTGEEEPVIFISERYNGIWIEHTFDGIILSDLLPRYKRTGWAHISAFMNYLLPDGQSEEQDRVMKAWISAWSKSKKIAYGQELYSHTGEASDCSPWYSSTMLFFLSAAKRIYGERVFE